MGDYLGSLGGPQHQHKGPDEREARRLKEEGGEETPATETGVIPGRSPG